MGLLSTFSNTPQRNFRNKIVVVTGASADVDRTTALTLAKAGARVALIAQRVRQRSTRVLRAQLEVMRSLAACRA